MVIEKGWHARAATLRKALQAAEVGLIQLQSGELGGCSKGRSRLMPMREDLIVQQIGIVNRLRGQLTEVERAA